MQRQFLYHYTCIGKDAQTFPSPLRGGIIETAFAITDARSYAAVRKMVADSPDGGQLISLSFLHTLERIIEAPAEQEPDNAG